MFLSTVYESPVGSLVLVCNEDGSSLVGLWPENQKHPFTELSEADSTTATAPGFVRTRTWLDQYFAGERPTISELPLAPIGGEFRQQVWALLREIPYGDVTTYGAIAKEVAARMGKTSMSSQAVGGAVGHNPISIIIPCHRVIGASGSLIGYGGGMPMKVSLLTHEGVDLTKLTIPTRGTAL